VAPPLTLLLLAPLVAEYLLGDFRITNLAPLPFLVCTYGCGAVLIREFVRRKGGSWTVYLALAVAFAVIGEGIVDQTFFNPDFMHGHLLAYGFWPRLGTAPAWVICVTTGHVVWSLAVPIGLTESLFPNRSREPWLGWPGITVAALLFVLGNLAIGSFFYRTQAHHASLTQITACSVLILGLLTFAMMRRRAQPTVSRPHVDREPVLLVVGPLIAGSLFVSLYWAGVFLHWPANVTLALELGLDVLVLSLLCIIWPGAWTALEVWSATTGGLLVYAWHGYIVDRALHGAGAVLGHTPIVLGLCAVQAAAWFRVAHFRDDDMAN
jgi:hypothetical protein